MTCYKGKCGQLEMAFHFITICISYYFLCLSFPNNPFALILDLSTGSHGAHRHLILLETNGAKEVDYPQLM